MDQGPCRRQRLWRLWRLGVKLHHSTLIKGARTRSGMVHAGVLRASRGRRRSRSSRSLYGGFLSPCGAEIIQEEPACPPCSVLFSSGWGKNESLLTTTTSRESRIIPKVYDEYVSRRTKIVRQIYPTFRDKSKSKISISFWRRMLLSCIHYNTSAPNLLGLRRWERSRHKHLLHLMLLPRSISAEGGIACFECQTSSLLMGRHRDRPLHMAGSLRGRDEEHFFWTRYLRNFGFLFTGCNNLKDFVWMHWSWGPKKL